MFVNYKLCEACPESCASAVDGHSHYLEESLTYKWLFDCYNIEAIHNTLTALRHECRGTSNDVVCACVLM